MKKKISTAEYAETAEDFFQKTQNMNPLMNISTSLRPPGSLRLGFFLTMRNQTIFRDPPGRRQEDE